ncbi:MAG: proteasome activator [Acidimicrobiales bacterium]
MPDTDLPDDDRTVDERSAPRVEVIRPDLVEPGSPDGAGDDGPTGTDGEAAEEPTEFVSEPAKVMRVGSMIKQLLDEVRTTQLDEPGRERLKAIYDTSITELGSALSPDLRDELNRLALPFDGGDLPSDVELRLAQAQLVGWLEGLFHGIQATLFAQQMAARQQLENMRGQLPPGTGTGPGGGPVEERPGTYL